MRSGVVFMGVVLAVVGCVSSSGAQTTARAGVAAKLSTLGAGVDLAVPAGDKVNVRVGFNALSADHDFDRDGITLAAQLKLRSVSALVDWFPLGGGFHLSPGVMLFNGNKVDAVATVPGGRRFTLAGTDLVSNPATPVTGEASVSFERVAPMFVLGWGNIVPRGARRWSVPVELGVVYSRAPTAALSLNGSACLPNGTNCRNVATDPTLRSLVAQEQADLNDDIDILKVIPVISFGFSYSF